MHHNTTLGSPRAQCRHYGDQHVGHLHSNQGFWDLCSYISFCGPWKVIPEIWGSSIAASNTMLATEVWIKIHASLTIHMEVLGDTGNRRWLLKTSCCFLTKDNNNHGMCSSLGIGARIHACTRKRLLWGSGNGLGRDRNTKHNTVCRTVIWGACTL